MKVDNMAEKTKAELGFNHIMIDIEALGTQRDCVIVSVGATRFNLSTGKIESKKYWELSMREQQQKGRTISADTVQWWSYQSTSTIMALQSNERKPILDFIKEFDQFIEGKCFFWAKGTNYDLEIISDLYRLYEQKPPFRYSKWVDARVYYFIGKYFGILPQLENQSAHNALEDATFQTKVVCAIHAAMQKHIPRRNQK